VGPDGRLYVVNVPIPTQRQEVAVQPRLYPPIASTSPLPLPSCSLPPAVCLTSIPTTFPDSAVLGYPPVYDRLPNPTIMGSQILSSLPNAMALPANPTIPLRSLQYAPPATRIPASLDATNNAASESVLRITREQDFGTPASTLNQQRHLLSAPSRAHSQVHSKKQYPINTTGREQRVVAFNQQIHLLSAPSLAHSQVHSEKLHPRNNTGREQGLVTLNQQRHLLSAPSLAHSQVHSEKQHPRNNTGREQRMVVPNRPPEILYTEDDDHNLSAYQCLVRQQIEIFQALAGDVEASAQGRNIPIALGQVGIRCRHCSHLSPRHRNPASCYFPRKLCGIYQTAQNMSSVHLRDKCVLVPTTIRQKLLFLKEQKATNTGGRKYWINHAATDLGVCSIEGQGMRFLPR
jgi:hypothetical protein